MLYCPRLPTTRMDGFLCCAGVQVRSSTPPIRQEFHYYLLRALAEERVQFPTAVVGNHHSPIIHSLHSGQACYTVLDSRNPGVQTQGTV